MPAQWSRMRLWSLISAIVCGLAVCGLYISAMAYTGDFRGGAEFWLVVIVGVIFAVAHIGAAVRDRILDGQRAIQRAIDDLPLHIVDYGDRREVSGHKLAMGVAKVQRRGLAPVE